MGIKSLSKFLRDRVPDVFDLIHITEYRYKKIAIDTSLYMCHYKASYGDAWLGAFLKLVSVLRSNDIHCVFIYDSVAPIEKQDEKKERMEAREKQNSKVYDLERAIEKYNEEGIVDPLLLQFQEKRKITSGVLGNARVNIKAIEYMVSKMRKQLFTITPHDFETTRQLFDILDVPYFIAPSEAETMCADLCKQGKVDAVLSEDTDVLAYSTPVFLTKINVMDSTCVRINHDRLLEKLCLSEQQFLDFCIMCGTDYNKNIFRVGPTKAYSLIKEHGSIEKVRDVAKLDVSILKHERTRELFQKYAKSDKEISYCGRPDFEQLSVFIFRKNARINADDFKNAFNKNNVRIEDE